MRIKALQNYSGMITMSKDEERNVRDEIAKDLVNAGYAEIIGPSPDETPDGAKKGADKKDK